MTPRPGRTRHTGRLGALLGLAIALGAPATAAAQYRPLIIRQLSFQGNHAISSDTLAAYIYNTNSSVFARSPLLRWIGLGQKRVFDETEFRKDSNRILVFYKHSGYPDVKVTPDVRRTPTDVYITFRITEGMPTRLDHFDISGIDSVKNKPWRLHQDLPIEAGDVASDYKLHEAVDTIAMRLRNEGYPTAVVDLDPKIHGDTSYLRADSARILVTTGRYARFGALRVTGQTKMDTSIVSSLLTARPGNEYRLEDIFRSQRALYATDLFRYASVGIDTSRFAVGDTVVPLIVNVTDNYGHQAKSTVGLGTEDCFRTSAGWTARNFPADGLTLDVSGRLSKIGVGSPFGFGMEHSLCSELKNDSVGSRVANYGLDASLRRNAFLSPENTGVLSLFAERRSEFEVYLRTEIGASFSVTRVTAANIPVTVAYRLSNGTTQATPALFCAFFNTCDPEVIKQLQQRRFQGTLSATLDRQRVNNPLDPSRGTALSVSATTSQQWLGSSSSQQFTRFVGDASGYLPISRTMMVAAHVRAGIVFAPPVDLATGVENFIPPDQRFYAGGANDVRGYDQNELGPVVYVVPTDSISSTGTFPATATRVAATGGTRVAIANVELRLPYFTAFSEQVRFVVFVDGGRLSNAALPTPFRITPGVGLRIASPIGPIRLDLGYNPYRNLQAGTLYSISTDGTLTELQTGYVKVRPHDLTFHVSVGQAF
jgi:outer membrane protein assembly complex protein YaeT